MTARRIVQRPGATCRSVAIVRRTRLSTVVTPRRGLRTPVEVSPNRSPKRATAGQSGPARHTAPAPAGSRGRGRAAGRRPPPGSGVDTPGTIGKESSGPFDGVVIRDIQQLRADFGASRLRRTAPEPFAFESAVT